MNTTISMESSIYTLGYKTANLTTADDDDWYKVNLTKGISIFADIRNMAGMFVGGNETSHIDCQS